MPRKSYIAAKVVRVIKSCNTLDQIDSARKLIRNYQKLHNKGDHFSPLWKILNIRYEEILYRKE